jgi:hypothetical protein
VVLEMTPQSDPHDSTTPDQESSAQLAALDRQLGELADEVRVRGREIDALQASDKHRPWYRQVTSLVAIGALVVSLLSAVAGFQLQTNAETRAQSRERAQDRSDLRSILQRLIVLPVELQSIHTEYPNMAGELSKTVTSEYALLTGQAGEIIEQLRRAGKDDVSASEYNTLAIGLIRLAGGEEKARTYYERAADRADNLTDASTAARGIAGLDFAEDSFEDMRAQFELAVEVIGKYDAGAYLRASSQTETYMQWAGFEIAGANCAHGREALQRAEEEAAQEKVFTLDPSMNARYQGLLTSLSQCS